MIYIADTFADDFFGTEEGATCNRFGCDGILELIMDGECRCVATQMPPCTPCETSRYGCRKCGWDPDEE